MTCVVGCNTCWMDRGIELLLQQLDIVWFVRAFHGYHKGEFRDLVLLGSQMSSVGSHNRQTSASQPEYGGRKIS